MWVHKIISLRPFRRGYHLITDDIERELPELGDIKTGILTLFLQHTSASLSINENADPTVRSDMETVLNKLVPENANYYQHVFEGSDDMPAHVKSALLGVSITIPVSQGRLMLGTWQGVYLGEHRNQGGSRNLVATLVGESF